MSHRVVPDQEFSQRVVVNSPQLAAGAIPITSMGMSGDLLLTVDAAAGTADWTLPAGVKIRIVDVAVVRTAGTGAGPDTLQVRTGAGAAISDAIDINDADTIISRASTLNDATWEIAGGGTVRIVTAGADNVACICIVTYVRVP